MMNYAAQQWSTDLAYPLLDRLAYRKVLAPCGFSGLFNRKYERYFKALPHRLSQYDHLVFHSHTYRDVQFAREHDLAAFPVIPNGASEEEFDAAEATFRQLHGIPEEMPLLLSVCNHTPAKGHGLVMEAFRHGQHGTRGARHNREVDREAQLPAGLQAEGRSYDARQLAAGSACSCWTCRRSETLAAYKAADLFLFGSRIECSPLVLFEAVASRTPFISTACGNAEEIAAWTGGGVIVPSKQNGDGTVTAEPSAMAVIIEELLCDRHKRETMAEAGFNAWRERFTWDHIVDQYERLYQTLVEKDT